ncbi:MAG: histone deacetylase [Ardenticatenaceae bacterium]|nr:histone deacetylase [Ardenticatenaceae bacterium]MCB8991294.1 histone deacetylase [Ardenticatenaceae bacterium]MCB9003665.1 histone deacetylase [Ardenticatenaceae bacterium]
MSTALVYAPAHAHTWWNHPENHDRLAKLLPTLERFGVLSALTAVSPIPATVPQLRRVHAASLIERIRGEAQRGGGLLDHGDTYVTPESYELALLAAGGVTAAVDAMLSGQVQNGMALVRPPGHHAEVNRAGGFCLFNNVAVAARHAQDTYGIQRVFIVDFDVHHGNGTQHIFYQDESVLFASLHLYMPNYFYPGIGSLGEIGQGKGNGYTVNVPLPPHVGDVGYGRVLRELIRPKAVDFAPDLILVSAGFDAHWQDPLASAGLSLTGYAGMARELVSLAEDVCDGRILFVLEGGYHQDVLAYGILNVIYALLGRDDLHDPLGPQPTPEQDVTDLLQKLKRRHLPY